MFLLDGVCVNILLLVPFLLFFFSPSLVWCPCWICALPTLWMTILFFLRRERTYSVYDK
ncbi:uncharacterized protein BJX67DRAFT_339564 [Aspergillus lucknowensis]|uniref:Uncharacterized protein n=1 Tax=Aspergillus lucknowensis TaxID=176173 RepID=A0ABR4M778_9EURO